MTNEEAIIVLKKNKPVRDTRYCGKELCEACDIAISAIEKQIYVSKDDITESIFNPRIFKCFIDAMYQGGYQQGEKDGINKFVEWFKKSDYYLCYHDTIDEVLTKYKEEKKNADEKQ